MISQSLPISRLANHPCDLRALLLAQLLGTLTFLTLRPLLGLAHELLVVGLAAGLWRLTEASLWTAVVGGLPLDPVYTLAMIRFAGEIQARGVAVSGPVGTVLHAGWPELFLPPELANGRWASAVLEPGATVLARGLVEFGANVGLLGVGLALLVAGWRGKQAWLAICGGLQQAHLVLHHLLGAELSLRDLEAAGLPFAASSILSRAAERPAWFTNELARWPEPLVAAAAGTLLTLLAYAGAGLLVATFWVGQRQLSRVVWRAGRELPRARMASLQPRPMPAAVIGLSVLALGLTPLGTFAEVETRLAGGPDGAETVATDAAMERGPGVTDGSERGGRSGPTEVQFSGRQYRYSVLVDGRPTVIRGMGYNAQYSKLPPDERARLYDRDFSQMRALGVNTIFGWFESEFDRLTLDKAHEHGLGVGMPYELNQDLNYDDPDLRARLSADVLRQVAEYKDHPTVWFWTPANEFIHRVIFPSWLKREPNPVGEARAASFARFYVELIDRVHELDPRHPVIYRDAEEVYLPRLLPALREGGVARPWFGYGANVYSRRLGEILQNWPNQGLDAPLFLSEFAPGGTGPVDRPQALRSMWATIRSYPDYVIGGAVYTWTTDGPEELDKVFGLVDGAGQPRDGGLAAIAELYGGAVPPR